MNELEGIWCFYTFGAIRRDFLGNQSSQSNWRGTESIRSITRHISLSRGEVKMLEIQYQLGLLCSGLS